MVWTERGKRYYDTDGELDKKVRTKVVPRVREALAEPANKDCPNHCLCHNVDIERVATLVKQFSDLSSDTDGVYVLECKSRRTSQRAVREELHLQHDSWWVDEAQRNDRLLYVGVSKNVVNRLQEHAAARGSGANFTQMFPAQRLLSVEWYPAVSVAYRAEEITAAVLDDVTDDGIMVHQPG